MIYQKELKQSMMKKINKFDKFEDFLKGLANQKIINAIKNTYGTVISEHFPITNKIF